MPTSQFNSILTNPASPLCRAYHKLDFPHSIMDITLTVDGNEQKKRPVSFDGPNRPVWSRLYPSTVRI